MSSTAQKTSIEQREAELVWLETEYWKRRDRLPEDHPKVQYWVSRFIRRLKEYEEAVRRETA